MIIFFITILARKPSLVHIVKTTLFWSFKMTFGGNPRYLREIVLNIGLFVPLGWFLAGMINGKYRVLAAFTIAILLSILIETIQYFTYRGYCDVDDLISNTIGAGIGIGVSQEISGEKLRRIVNYVLLLIGICGCFYTIFYKVEPDNADFFDFQIRTAVYTDGIIEMRGTCYKYSEETSLFELMLVSGMENKKADIINNGQGFIAVATSASQKKYEIKVKFTDDKWVSTGTYLRLLNDGVEIEYVPDEVEIPNGIPENAILKAYSSYFDTYIFENDNNILWLIGMQTLNSNTEIIYHLHTDEPEKLPKERIQYGFDNRGFRVKTGERHENEIEALSHYRVFQKEIPRDYRITEIVVGFNTDGTIVWRDSFRIKR